MRKTLITICVGCGLLLGSLGGWTAQQIEAQLLVFQVAETGSEPYVSRVLVTPGYLRMDQGRGDPGFILFDRQARVIHSVNPYDRTILEIAPRLTDRTQPPGMRLSARRKAEPGMPRVAGKQPEHWQFLVNDRLCRSAVVVPGLMAQAGAAYAEYLDLLAYEQQATQHAIPPELQDPCDMAIHVYAPLVVLEKGLPLQQWNTLGRRQELVDFRPTFAVPADSFRLPEDFRRIKMGGT